MAQETKMQKVLETTNTKERLSLVCQLLQAELEVLTAQAKIRGPGARGAPGRPPGDARGDHAPEPGVRLPGPERPLRSRRRDGPM